MSTDDALVRIEAAIGALAHDVETLRDDVELLASRGRLSRDERAMLERLLPAAAAVVRDAAFTAGDLLEMPSLSSLLDGYGASSAAWLLGRAVGSRIGGFRVERIGTDRAGALWRLRAEVTAPARNDVRQCVVANDEETE